MVDMRLWIDDLSQMVKGSRGFIRKRLVRVLSQTSEGLAAEGLQVAAKSVVLCSDHRDAKVVSSRLRARGITVVPVLQASYLGIDTGAGRHARATKRQRVVKGLTMHKKIARFARASSRYRPTMRLEAAAAQPASLYGHQIYGVFGSDMQGMRRRLSHVASSAKRGRCVTTMLDIQFDGQDPGYRLPCDCLKLWLTSWFSIPKLRASVKLAWPKVVEKLSAMDANQRSRNIRGPMAAVITYLLQYQWDPVAATEWGTRPQGDPTREAFIFDGDLDSDTDFSDLLQEFELTIRRRQWSVAASHYCGAGLEGGADNRTYRQYIKQLEAAPKGHQLAQMMLCVAVGGTWPRQRVADEAGDTTDVLCPRCREAPETAFHTIG